MNPAERSALELRLRDDSKDYYQASLVSLVDALTSIPFGFYSWATVKLYYSVFYALRARLAISGECIFYASGKPRYINTTAGCSVAKLEGTTHSCVLKVFAKSAPRDFFLSQEIEAKPPLEWLMAKREEVNYKLARFTEPVIPSYFKFASSTNLRSMLGAYQADDLYIFDADHAIVAFPFRLLLDLRSRLTQLSIVPLQTVEIKFLEASTKDKSGIITAMQSLLG